MPQPVLATRRTVGVDHIDLVVERALVEQARTDRAAFALLYRNHVNAVYAFAYRRCASKEVAEEATSAAFERALRSIAGYEWRDAGIRPWLLRIASNEVAEIFRKRSRLSGPRGQLALQALATTHEQTQESTSGDEIECLDLAAMHRALDRLPERYRAGISLRYLAPMSATDAAAELGCTNAVLAVTLHRALSSLRKELTSGVSEARTINPRTKRGAR